MYTNILLAVALQNWEIPTPHAEAARDVAIGLAKGFDRRLHVLTVYHLQNIGASRSPSSQTPEDLEERSKVAEQEVREKLDDFVAEIEEEGVDVNKLVILGNPRELIVKTAKEIQADLIIMGAHSRGSVTHGILGGTAHIVCSQASCPVILVSLR
ncbi:MAG: universal stress protein [Candidatus Tectomicrobia bacterium]|nr:universal stress protein [Candidatus Tectomicrobia bacterium]